MTSDLKALPGEGLKAIQFPHDLVVRSRVVALNFVCGACENWCRDFVSVIEHKLAKLNSKSSSTV